MFMAGRVQQRATEMLNWNTCDVLLGLIPEKRRPGGFSAAQQMPRGGQENGARLCPGELSNRMRGPQE